MTITGPNKQSAKRAELTIIGWLLECGWQCFSPIVDDDEIDVIAKIPGRRDFLPVQIKHKRTDGKNQGQLANLWSDGQASFDYLILYQPSFYCGFILPRNVFVGRGRTLRLNRRTRTRTLGPASAPYQPYEFDLGVVTDGWKADAFCRRLLEVHESASSGEIPPNWDSEAVRARYSPIVEIQ
jgi:hypothetical protein